MMRFSNLLVCLGCIFVLHVNSLQHGVRITSMDNSPECFEPSICSKLKLVKGTIRNLWECWYQAPRKCWYIARITLDGPIPKSSICKTIDYDFAIDISGYRPSFIKSGPTVGSMIFTFPINHNGACQYWLKSGEKSNYQNVNFIDNRILDENHNIDINHQNNHNNDYDHDNDIHYHQHDDHHHDDDIHHDDIRHHHDDIHHDESDNLLSLSSQVNLDSCELQHITHMSAMPLYVTEYKKPKQMIAESSLADFLMSQNNLIVLQGLNEKICGKNLDNFHFDGLTREVLFFGILGHPSSTTTPSPTTTTTTLSPTTTTLPVQSLDKISYCLRFIQANGKNLPHSYCQKVCEKFATQSEWEKCDAMTNGHINEKYFSCVLDFHPGCADSREFMSYSVSFSSPPLRLNSTASSRSYIAARDPMRVSGQAQTYEQWRAAALSWKPTLCPAHVASRFDEN